MAIKVFKQFLHVYVFKRENDCRRLKNAGISLAFFIVATCKIRYIAISGTVYVVLCGNRGLITFSIDFYG